MGNQDTSNKHYQEMEAIQESHYPSTSSLQEVEAFHKEMGLNSTIEELLDQLMNHSSLVKNHHRILEFVCDNGIMLNYSKKYKLELFGVDINGKSIEAGHRHFPELNLVKSTGLEIPFRDDYFDVIFASAVLKHIRQEDREKIYQEFSRVSKYIIVWEKNSEKKTVEEMGGFKFYHSNFMEELEFFFHSNKLIEINNDILGLYEKK